MKESKYAHSLDRCEVESVVNPLKDKEPTPAWKQKLNEVLKHYGVSFRKLTILAQESGRTSLIGKRYNMLSLKNTIANFMSRKGAQTWTRNAQQTVNDHLDILVDYLSRNDDLEPGHYESVMDIPEPEEHHPSLLERLEKERAEGKWPSVDEKKAFSKLMARATDSLKPLEDSIPEYDGLGKSDGVKVKLRKVRKHKKRKVTINIYI